MLGDEALLAASAALTASVLVGSAIPLARLLGILDHPGPIKIHSRATPRAGGLGIFATIMLWTIIRGLLSGLRGAGFCIVFFVGLMDDWIGLTPRVKLVGEVAAGALLGLDFVGSMGWSGPLAGIVVVPMLTNAVNLTDGMNGLASGSAALSAIGLSMLLERAGAPTAGALILSGALLGFLVWNFPKARTFMGDSGSLSVGFALSVLLLELAHYGRETALAGLIMVGFPLWDMCMSVVRRLKRGTPVFQGDRSHVYDRVRALVRHDSATTVVLWFCSVLFVLIGLVVGALPLGLGLSIALVLAGGLTAVAHWVGAL